MKLASLVIGLSLCACTITKEPKFAEVADLLCDELTTYETLGDGIASVHILIQRGDYTSALKVADEILASLDEEKEIEGARELRALIFLLQSIVKGDN